jgi:hypothetical protein
MYQQVRHYIPYDWEPGPVDEMNKWTQYAQYLLCKGSWTYHEKNR